MHKRGDIKYRRLLNEICENCNDSYCFLKELIIEIGTSERLLLQLKCVEKFKYEESERQKMDIGWQQAWLKWIEIGYAARFSEFYSDNPYISFKEIYRKIVNV